MFAQALATEFLKLHRSKVTWFSLAALSLGPLAIALMMWIVREPGRAAQLGLLGTKANLSGLTATWPAYFSMLTMVVGMGGMLLLAFVVAYIFGREYTEGTAKNLLALPVGRHWFALAMLLLGDVFSHTGWAAWFPWSIVPLLIGAIGKPATTVAASSLVVVALTFLAGIAATIAQLRWADNTQ